MTANRKQMKVGEEIILDTSLIYSRILCLQTSRDIDMNKAMKHELSPIPTSLFDDQGDMHIAKSKSTLKNKLQVVAEGQGEATVDAVVIDGCAMLWVIPWPATGTVQDFLDNVGKHVSRYLKSCDTHLIFDRYYEKSIKQGTRESRVSTSQRHQLSQTTPIPGQKSILTVTANKVQLIQLIVDFLQGMAESLSESSNKLYITGQGSIPILIEDGLVMRCMDLETTHEEADVMIIQRVLYLESEGKLSIEVISDDTDIFILLVHFYTSQPLTCDVVMTGMQETVSADKLFLALPVITISQVRGRDA